MNETLQTDILSNENDTPVCVLPRVSRSFFKAFIRVVKSIAFNDYCGFDTVEVIREPLIEAKDKNEVKWNGIQIKSIENVPQTAFEVIVVPTSSNPL